jgi:protein-tyrosine phosphatase
MSYVDLHVHLLPGVDDGARDEQESLTYARRLVREGVRDVTVTQHIGHPGFPIAPTSVADHVADLQELVDRHAPGLRLHPGGEIHASAAAGLDDFELDAIAHGPEGSRWVLLEVPFRGIDDGFVATCENLRDRGFGVLIAHPERASGFLPRGLEMLRPQLQAGALLQVNVDSLLGHHGLDVQETAVHLLRNGLAFVLASDAHPGTRDQTLRLGFDLALAAGASSVQAWRLTQANPRFLLRQGIPRTPSRIPTAAAEAVR